MSESNELAETETAFELKLKPSARPVPREATICAVCADDISTNLGRRRLLFHWCDPSRADSSSQVVRQLRDLMALFAPHPHSQSEVQSDLSLSHCTQQLVESMASKWCCRRCERMVDNIYKKLCQLRQFYNQFRDCPLSQLIRSLSLDNSTDVNTDPNSADQTITIHGLFITDSELNEECTEIAIVTNPTNECEEQERQSMETTNKKRKSTEDELQTIGAKPELDCREDQFRRKTRSKTTESIKKEKNVKNTKNTNNNEVKSELNLSEMSGTKSETDKQILYSLSNSYYEGVMRALLADDELRSVAIREVAKFVSRECLSAGTEVAKMSHSVESLRVPELKKAIETLMPSTQLLFSVLIGKERLVSAPVVAMISILVYALNSHANLFQKMIATLLLHSKCNPSTIERLHSYKLTIAYETLVSFLDQNRPSTQIPKLIKAFQL